jgi:hypothetical protein
VHRRGDDTEVKERGARDRAVVDEAKLHDYCLNPSHLRGRHKARVFQSALGLTQQHTEQLRNALLLAAATGDATRSEQDVYGRRYTVDFDMDGPAGAARVRSTWIIRAGEQGLSIL